MSATSHYNVDKPKALMKKPPDSIRTTHSEADRFKDFARKIVTVPKTEIDEQQAMYEREKLTRKKPRERVVVKR